jgi:hypothetical protein
VIGLVTSQYRILTLPGAFQTFSGWTCFFNLHPLGLDSGLLVIFDRRKEGLPIEKRLRSELHHTDAGRAITVIYA